MRISDWSSDVCASDLLDGAVEFGDAVLDRLEGADRLAERLTRQGIIARDLHQRLGAAGLFVRGDDRLQRQNVERGGASRLAGDEGFGGGARQNEIGNAAAVVETVDRHSLDVRSEAHTSELQSLLRISYAVFCLKKKTYK